MSQNPPIMMKQDDVFVADEILHNEVDRGKLPSPMISYTGPEFSKPTALVTFTGRRRRKSSRLSHA